MEQGRTKVPVAVAQFMDAEGSIASTTRLQPRNLKYFRTRFSLTQGKVAALAGVSRVTWSQWENGKSKIPSHLKATLTIIGETLSLKQPRGQNA
jgi:DNA-binding transcriptional regulator YiaG